MKFTIKKEDLLPSLQLINISSNEKKNSSIFNNLLLKITKKNSLILISINSEIDIVSRIILKENNLQYGKIIISKKKILDICKNLPNGSVINFKLKNNQIFINSKFSKFILSTLPLHHFPKITNFKIKITLHIVESKLKRSIDCTYFSMSDQDSRYYLNGMLFEIWENNLNIVTTDGYRLSLSSVIIKEKMPNYSIIIPKKSILELKRMLKNNKNNILKLEIGDNKICINSNDYIFISKTIQSQFPDYKKIFIINNYKIIIINSNTLQQSIKRISVLTNEKSKIVKFFFNKNKLTLTTNNQENEKAEETIFIEYKQEQIEICFNINYIMDVLNITKNQDIKLLITNEMSCMQIENCLNSNEKYVIMPIKL